jgi:hypothetical protein
MLLQPGSREIGDRWCILRTSPAKTLGLVRSLTATGIDAWSPKHIVFRRRPRSNHVDELEVPIAPTFVFVRAVHFAQVLFLQFSETPTEHPQFSVFRLYGRAPLVNDEEIWGLREEEAKKLEAARDERAALDLARRRAEDKRAQSVRREQRRAGRRAPSDIEPGTQVAVQDSAWTGMTGILMGIDGQTAHIDFGGPFGVKVDAWLLSPATVTVDLSPTRSAAA